MTATLEQQYRWRHETILVPAAQDLEELVQRRLSGAPRIDRIYARAKGVSSFLEKSQRKDKSRRKYANPLAQIHDQIAARILVLFQDDVDPTADRVLEYFAKAEQTKKEPESEWTFGYFGANLLLPLPADVIPEGVDPNEAPRLFELQIRTLFQHAWSETNHDLGYKPDMELSSEETRKLAFTSAQAWGADNIFNALHRNQRARKSEA